MPCFYVLTCAFCFPGALFSLSKVVFDCVASILDGWVAVGSLQKLCDVRLMCEGIICVIWI